MRQRLQARLLLVCCTVLGLLAAAVNGQTTGAIDGRALEASGVALAGVKIEAWSPSLQGRRTATTLEDGVYRLPGLPPGSYTVQASMKGFTTVQKTARVALNAMSTADFMLQVSAEESVVVGGETPEIDLGSAATGTTYPATVLRRIAIIRNYADILRLQPGVQPDTAATQGRAAPLAIYGSTSIENLYLIDGVNTNDVKQAFQGTVLPPEAIEEVEVKTGGYGAEYGHAIGGIINAVTRSGGNEFHGDVFGYYNSPGMRADVKVTDQDILAAEQTTIDRWDAGADLGGYILKDRLWFFGSYDRVGQTTDRIPAAGTRRRRRLSLRHGVEPLHRQAHLERRSEHERRRDGLRGSRGEDRSHGDVGLHGPPDLHRHPQPRGNLLRRSVSISSSARRSCWPFSTPGTRTNF